MRRGLQFLLALGFALPLAAQQNPVLLDPPGVVCPPIARAAHVEGDVAVTFRIDPGSGATLDVTPASGPLMLSYSLATRIKTWRFHLPLPINAQNDFTATYKFRLYEDDEDLDDDLDAPLPGGDYGTPPGKITGEAHNADGLTIDLSATAPPPPDRCAQDTEKQPPTETSSADTIELRRYACFNGNNCEDYRVILQRSGLISWFGRAHTAVLGERQALLSPAVTDALFAKALAPQFWAGCSVKAPLFRAEIAKPNAPQKGEDDNDEDDNNVISDFIIVTIARHTKAVLPQGNSFMDDTGIRFAWAIDRATDTHQWRHPDSSIEPYTNMREDLALPKPGMTKLIRATFRFHGPNQTFAPLKAMLAHGENPNEADSSGWTPLMYAFEVDQGEGQNPAHEGPVQLLLSAQANANQASLHGDTPLMVSAYHGTLSKLLLNHGANINARNVEGVTALMLLVQHMDADELKDALVAGADANAQDNLGRTALDYLVAASCNRPIIPLPAAYVTIEPGPPPPCPADTSEFKQSEALLKAAMKTTATRP